MYTVHRYPNLPNKDAQSKHQKCKKKKRAPCLPFLSAAWPSVPLEFQPAQAAEQDLETYGDWGYLYLGNHIIYIYTYNNNYNFDYYYIYNG